MAAATTATYHHNPRRVVTTIKKSLMPRDMEMEAVAVGVRALQQTNIEKEAARIIKDDFDSRYGGQWHCVVGRQFGCYVSHFPHEFVYFYANSVAVLLFRTDID